MSRIIEKLKIFTIQTNGNHYVLVRLFNPNVQYQLEKLTIHAVHLVLPQIKMPHLTEILLDAYDTREKAMIEQFFVLNQENYSNML